MTPSPERRRPLARLLRALGLGLLGAFVVGFAIGTWLRCELETPVRYLGSAEAPGPRG